MTQREPLDRAFNVAVITMANRLMPTGFDVSSDAPQTYEDLKAHYAATGRIAVWDGASETTIFADAEVNYAFRAWHDWVHLKHAQPFTAEGERNVAKIMQDQLRAVYGPGVLTDWFCTLIAAEVVGQLDYQAVHGQFPEDQARFATSWLFAQGLPTSRPVLRPYQSTQA